MAVTQQLSPAYPQSSRLDERGVLEIGGCDALELAREFGTPALRRLRGRPARPRARDPGGLRRADRALRGALRVEGVPVHRGLPGARRGGPRAATSPPAASCAIALAAGFDPGADPLPRQREVRRRAARGARRRRRARSSSTTRDEIERLEALLGGRDASACCCASRPTSAASTHATISTGQADSKFGVSTGRRAAPPSRACRPRRRFDLAGLHLHIGSQLLDSSRSVRAVAAVRRARRLPGRQRRRRPRRRLHRRRRAAGIEEYVAAKVDAVRGAPRPRPAIVDEPGRALVANVERDALHRAVGQAQRLDLGRPSTAACPTTCARCSTAPATRRRSPTASAATRSATSPASTASRATSSSRDVRLDDPRPGDVLVTPATGAYGYAMANNYNGVPAPARRVRQGRRRAASSCAARPTRTCLPETFDVGLLGHGTVGSAFAELLDARTAQIETTTGLRPRAVGRAHALARGLRRDPRPRPTSSSRSWAASTRPASTCCARCAAGRHVVTANKQLLSRTARSCGPPRASTACSCASRRPSAASCRSSACCRRRSPRRTSSA